MKERIAESECKTVIKKNSVLLVETLITGSPDLLQPMSHDEMLAYMKRAYDFMSERAGEQNIVSAVIHLDEKTPHMHLCFVPLSEDNRLTAKEIVGNKEMLQHLWLNLLENAIKYTPVGGEITVRTSLSEKNITVEISDSGEGMNEDVLKHLFDPYYQGDTSHASQGLGLGLSIAKRIVELCKGEICVQSEPSVGSTFTVHLPRA